MTAPLSPKFDAAYYYSEEYDPEAYFKQFLEEAKAKKSTSSCKDITFSIPNEDVKFNEAVETKKKKSWKKSLFSWLKISDKKNRTAVEPLQDASVPKVRRRGFTSGPIRSDAISVSLRSRKPMSGPLNSLFNTSNKDEDDGPVEFPYMCLNQLKTLHDTHPYGPVYLVT